MKAKRLLAPALVLILSILLLSSMAAAQGPQDGPGITAALGTAFTYQGRLIESGSPADGTYDFEFRLFDAATGGTQIGSTLTLDNVNVDNGLFTVYLDFGNDLFIGQGRWLEIAVRQDGPDPFTPLSPRQELTPAPAALSLPGLWTQQNTTSPNLIGGYEGNVVAGGVSGATIGGGGAAGSPNRVIHNYGTVAGGWNNIAGNYASVGGGYENTADGRAATVPGGLQNEASGRFSFAAGRRAKALHEGAFVWADSTDADFASSAANQFLVRAFGGVQLETNGAGATVDGNTIWHTGNDGPGSALDADLLDGQQGSFYLDWSNLTGVPAGFADSIDNDVLGGLSCANGQIAEWNGSAWVCGDDDGAGTSWSLAGNAGTTPGTHFLGTTDNVALELAVNSTRALRLEPHATSPNVIGGYLGNSITAGVYGATIGGGGENSNLNRVTDNYGTVGGGRDNQSGDDAGTTSDRQYGTVAGGNHNTAGGVLATVGGGGYNTASSYAGTVPGGYSCVAEGSYSLAAGRRAQALHGGTFVWADSTNADFASTAANQFLVRASGGVQLETSGAGATVDGNTIWNAGNDGAGSALDADVLDGQQGSFYLDWGNLTNVPAGFADDVDNDVLGGLSCVNGQIAEWNGSAWVCGDDDTSGDSWSLTGNAGTTPGTHFVGTTDNVALELAVNSARALRLEPDINSPNLIGGHVGNSVSTGVWGATIGGGGNSFYPNRVTTHFGTVGGGLDNLAGKEVGNPGDASYATVGGGIGNVASGAWATVAGGRENTASGDHAIVPGGRYNTAQGQYSFAAGWRAKALHHGSFVWADSTDAELASTATDQFLVRANGGVSFNTGGAGFQIDGNTAWHAGNDGMGSGLNADLLDGQHGSYYQARVNYTCAIGASIRAINADGTVECEFDTPLNRSRTPTVNFHNTLDTGGNVGNYAAATIVWTGLPLISYYDATNADLKVAYCNDSYCNNATITSLDVTGDVGRYNSLVRGADGLGLISYYDVTNGNLKVAHCQNAACTSATITTLHSTGDVGQYTSVTIGSDGLGFISYYDATNGDLRTAHCSNMACTSATLSVPWSTGDGGRYTSVATGADGLPFISFHYATSVDLWTYHCDDANCSSGMVGLVDTVGNVGIDTSVVIGVDGLPLISYYDASNLNLKVAHCGTVDCGGVTITTLDSSTNQVGQRSSVTIGPHGLGLITYLDVSSEQMKMAYCNDLTCTSATITVPDSSIVVNGQTAVTIGGDGLPFIAFYETLNYDLEVIHCASEFCAPYFQRR